MKIKQLHFSLMWTNDNILVLTLINKMLRYYNYYVKAYLILADSGKYVFSKIWSFEIKKNHIRGFVIQFLPRTFCFYMIWKYLGESQRESGEIQLDIKQSMSLMMKTKAWDRVNHVFLHILGIVCNIHWWKHSQNT